MKNTIQHAIGLVAIIAIGGCAELIPVQPGHFPATAPAPVTVSTAPPTGAIYQPAAARTLFDDLKARQVGDTLTVQLAEKTQASKSATTDAKKDAAIDTGVPTLLGTSLRLGGKNLLSNTFESKETFDGQGSSSQSNSLNGNVTVTVAEVLPNGNLVVRGEKWLTLNQGEEYIQVTGIVRTTDIGTDNSVPSYKLADARINYSGKGTLADANRPGWLSRMLIKMWPL